MKKYEKTVWVDNQTNICAARLNNLESGLEEATELALSASDIIAGPGISLVVNSEGKLVISVSSEYKKIDIITEERSSYAQDVIYYLLDDSGKLKKIIINGVSSNYGME